MLEMLRAITQEVNSAHNLSSAMVVVVDRIRDAMKVKVCSLYLRDEAGSYVLRATQGLNPDAIGVVSMTPNEGLVGYVAKRGEPINLENAEVHSRYLYFPETGEERYASFLGVPIIHQKAVLGVLAVQQQERRRFDESDEAFLLTLSAQLSGIIAHAEATGGLDQYTQETADARFKGMPGVQGIAIGTVVVYSPAADLSSVPFQKTDNIECETRFFYESLGVARKEIQVLGSRLADRLTVEERTLFDAYL
jgi:phosphotransferase system enzyme I (PtsP)